ncbi:peptidyl-prolyl cis-trans isomerase FKBP53 [Trifolium pratense]|uniref:peptidyl-prolyl cis-trans isomerase FKBP53 n=1 Tax=Trifolium pratense TaxID=57577 RepID=UPI001E6961C4|nr:peptidyl-prolyl cis-trans isomerase FKBP53 [Trifolium pratense]
MGFWGIEVKPGKPVPYHTDNVQGKLHVTQATLGDGAPSGKSILQCSSGHKNPVYVCTLLPNKVETCSLNLKFDEEDLVAFSVIGSRSIHLSGYFVADDGDDLRDDYEYDSLGEDVGTDSEESSEYDSENGYDDHFFDDSDMEMYPSSPVPNSGVVIEEIPDDKPENGDDPAKQSKKKEQPALLKEKASKSSQLPDVPSGDNNLVLESEDEDGFPISTSEKAKKQTNKKTGKSNKKEKDVDPSASLKRKGQAVEEDEQLQDGKNKTKKNKMKDHAKEEIAHVKETNVTLQDEKHSEGEEVKTTTNQNNVSHENAGDDVKQSNNEVLVEKKNKKKKKKKINEPEGEAAANEITTTVENQKGSTSEKKGKGQTEAKPSNVITYPNGLVIEDRFMGKPDGKRADLGKQVSVKYIGKLKKDGKIFDSCIGKAPFKFRLGVGQVIKGWDVGINGMRVGDKRRLTIPPSMGYGDKRVGLIPQNSWLVFDVELVGVGN